MIFDLALDQLLQVFSSPPAAEPIVTSFSVPLAGSAFVDVIRLCGPLSPM